jgi:hypothetical protein
MRPVRPVVVSVVAGVIVTVPEAGTTALIGIGMGAVVESVVVRFRIREKRPVRVAGAAGAAYAAVVTPLAAVVVPLTGFTEGSGAGTVAGGVVGVVVLGVTTVAGAVITAPVLRRSRRRARRPRRAGVVDSLTTTVEAVVVVAGLAGSSADTGTATRPNPANSARIIRFMLLPPETRPVPEPTVDPVTGLESVYG